MGEFFAVIGSNVASKVLPDTPKPKRLTMKIGSDGSRVKKKDEKIGCCVW